MPVAGPALGDAVRQMLDAQGVVFHPLHKLTSVDPQARELRFENQAPFRYDLLVAVPPHRGPRLARESGLANEVGWIPVDRTTLATESENVYALGDVTAISIPGCWKPDVPLMLPKAGVFAHLHILRRRLLNAGNRPRCGRIRERQLLRGAFAAGEHVPAESDTASEQSAL